MEQFFRVAQVADEEKVSITGMYLLSDAKLWWRTRLEGDAELGRPYISTWETFKQELKEQFLPTNVAWLARGSLRRLKKTGTVRDYVKEFSSLMLDIKNMSEEDKLFNFVSGLQAWSQTELRRQGMKDLPAAMAATDCLVYYKLLGTTVVGKNLRWTDLENKRRLENLLTKQRGRRKVMLPPLERGTQVRMDSRHPSQLGARTPSG